jgi:hypothetical protein
MKHGIRGLALCVLVVLSGRVSAGVVVEMVTGDAEGAGQVDAIYAEDGMLRMDPHQDGGNDDGTVLFRDDTLWVIDHQEKRCHRIDEAGMKKVGEQLGAAMKMMESQMAQVPPEQREMMQKMMAEQMPGMAGALGGETPERRVEKGAVDQVGSYACTSYAMYSDDRKVWEVCSASESELGGDAKEVIEAARRMSQFAQQLRDAMGESPFADMVDTPFQAMDEIGGFPVRIRSYNAEGVIEGESSLKSITPEELDDDLFAVPDGYEIVNLADQIGQGP